MTPAQGQLERLRAGIELSTDRRALVRSREPVLTTEPKCLRRIPLEAVGDRVSLAHIAAKAGG